MNTVKVTTKIVQTVEVEMNGPITARDLGDFVYQVARVFIDRKGRKVKYDDDYMVVPTDEGLKAVFQVKSKESGEGE